MLRGERHAWIPALCLLLNCVEFSVIVFEGDETMVVGSAVFSDGHIRNRAICTEILWTKIANDTTNNVNNNNYSTTITTS